MKKYWRWLLVSELLVLLPMVFGFIMWNKLPESMAVHWGISGEADGIAGRLTAVILLPLILAAMNVLCIFLTLRDNAKREQSGKIIKMSFFFMPIISVFTGAVIYSSALGMKLGITMIFGVLFGILFIVIGNYMPKSTRNNVFGIKIRYTLANDENWNRTHRFCGRLYVIMGLISLILAFMPSMVFFIGLILLFVCGVPVPIVYSYALYKKDIKEGRAEEKDYKIIRTNAEKKTFIITVIAISAIIIGVLVLMFVGKIEYEFGTNEITVSSSFDSDFKIKYEDIESIEYREGRLPGGKVYGFSSARLLLGAFESEELGRYARYTYTGKNGAVIIKTADGYIALGCATPEETEELFDAIAIRIKER